MDRRRALLLLLVAAAFTGAGGLLAVRGDAGDRTVGLACIVFFGGCAVVFAGELLPRREPALDADGALVIRPDTRQTLVLGLAGLLMGAGSFFIGQLAWAGGERVMAWIGWGGAAFFGAGAPLAVVRLARARPFYRLDAHGIARPGAGGWTLPWRGIEDISVFGHAGQRWLALHVAPGVAAQHPPDARLNAVFGFPAFAVGAQGTGLGFDLLAALVVDHWTRHRGW